MSKKATALEKELQAYQRALMLADCAVKDLRAYVLWSLGSIGGMNCEAGRRALEALNRSADLEIRADEAISEALP